MIYPLIGLFITFFTYIDSVIRNRKVSQYSSFIILFVMLLLVSLRYKVGTDWDAYVDFYRGEKSTDGIEIGYAFLNNLSSKFLHLPYNLFILIINAFALALMFFFLKQNSVLLVVGLLIFFSDLFLYLNLSGIRQALALSITCFSIKFAIDRRFIVFLLFILLAACFHTTAILFLVVYFLPRKRIKWPVALIFIFGFLLCTIFLQSISDLITLYTLKSMEYYTNQQERADNLLSLFYIGIIKRSIILIVIFIMGRKLFDQANSYYFLNIYLFGFAIYLSTYMISPDIGARLSSYFTIFEMLLAGNLIYSVNRLSTRILITTIFIFMAFYKLLAYMSFETYVYQTIIDIF